MTSPAKFRQFKIGKVWAAWTDNPKDLVLAVATHLLCGEYEPSMREYASNVLAHFPAEIV